MALSSGVVCVHTQSYTDIGGHGHGDTQRTQTK